MINEKQFYTQNIIFAVTVLRMALITEVPRVIRVKNRRGRRPIRAALTVITASTRRRDTTGAALVTITENGTVDTAAIDLVTTGSISAETGTIPGAIIERTTTGKTTTATMVTDRPMMIGTMTGAE